MVQTRSQAAAARLQSEIDVVARLQSEIDMGTIDRFIAKAAHAVSCGTGGRPKGALVQAHQRCSKATQVVKQYLDAIIRVQGKDAKIVVVDRLLVFLAQPAATSLIELHPKFALSVLAKLNEFRTDPDHPTESVDRHVEAIFQRRGMFNHAAFYAHPTALETLAGFDILLSGFPQAMRHMNCRWKRTGICRGRPYFVGAGAAKRFLYWQSSDDLGRYAAGKQMAKWIIAHKLEDQSKWVCYASVKSSDYLKFSAPVGLSCWHVWNLEDRVFSAVVLHLERASA